MIRTGAFALRRIADVFEFVYPDDPQPGDSISVSRAEYDEVYDRLRNEGLPVRADREQAWNDFAGWRVNYDVVLLQLAALIDAPTAQWVSDRTVP